MRILGSKFCGHDSALCVIDTSTKEIFSISTERVTRIKHDSLDISPILDAYEFNNIDCFAHSWSDFANKSKDGELRAKMVFNKEIEKALRKIIKPKYIKDLTISRDLKRKLIVKSIFNDFKSFKKYYISKIKRAFYSNESKHNKKVFVNYISNTLTSKNLHPKNFDFFDHHKCHAFPAYILSPFSSENAISMTLDGKGDGFFSKVYMFNQISNTKLIGYSKATPFKHPKHNGYRWFSLGMIYENFTEAMDLIVGSDEGKVEARAAYAKPDINLLNQLKEATIIDQENLGITFDLELIKPFYDIDFLKKKRLEMGDPSFCAVVQTYLEDIIVDYLNIIYEKFPVGNLCLSGGVAANIIMSLNIYERTGFKNIYVLPPMGDDGTALGAAILSALKYNEDVSWLKKYHMPYFGDQFSRKEVKETLESFNNIIFEDVNDQWPEIAAKSVSKGRICALFHGRMEFGPRALGNRSIIANPMLENSRDKINSTVKRRPSYQPFCPSILEEERERLFDNSFPHKHMAIAFRMKKVHIKKLPCAAHIDGTARPQFVEPRDNKNFYRYLKELKKITGYGVSLNTSFNLHGRTIVRTPEDAVIDFIDCNLDELFIEGFRVRRKN